MKRVSDISARIKEYRDIHNLTLVDLEALTGIPAQTINRYELKKRAPKMEVAIELAEILNVNPLWLQGYDEEMTVVRKEEEKQLDSEIAARLAQLTPEEWAKVDAFVQGLLASR